jgi:ATP-dependent RNA helicase RhlE
MMFSATMPKKIKALATEILNNPQEITVHKVASTTSNIEQIMYNVKSSHKRQLLQQIIKRKDLKSILVFVRSRTDAERVLGYIKTA